MTSLAGKAASNGADPFGRGAWLEKLRHLGSCARSNSFPGARLLRFVASERARYEDL